MREKFMFIHKTRLLFGVGALEEAESLLSRLGRKALLVHAPSVGRRHGDRLKSLRERLASNGVSTVLFDRVHPNPRLADVQAAAELARAESVDFVIGMGGGSAMDTARAVAVAATHPGTAMDYLYFSKTQPTEATLPMAMIPTTSGSGAHMSCCSVITDESRNFKSALWNQDRLFADIAVVDPSLMVTVPKEITAATGFDVFAHLFESYINVNHSPMVDLFCLEGIEIVAEHLPALLSDLENLEHRSAMAYADTLAGMSIANVGTTVPHAMGQPISGHFPHVSHGQSLAVVYPEFLKYTMPGAVERFADIAGIFDPQTALKSVEEAAEACCDLIGEFLKEIGMWTDLDTLDVSESEMEGIVDHCMEFPDVGVNPRVPTREEVSRMYSGARRR